jgi:hypothetical protein
MRDGWDLNYTGSKMIFIFQLWISLFKWCLFKEVGKYMYFIFGWFIRFHLLLIYCLILQNKCLHKQTFTCYNACFHIFTVPSVPATCTCPAESSLGYCPHATDCTKYIQCDGMNEFTRFCPTGTVWYQNLVACAYGSQSNGCKWLFLYFIHSFIHSSTQSWQVCVLVLYLITLLYYEKKVYTVMINNSSNISTTHLTSTHGT